MDERREHARIDVYIPIKIKKVDPKTTPLVPKTSIDASLVFPAPLEYPRDPILSDWLKHINAKLDAILSLLTVEKKEPELEYRMVTISAGGLSVITKELFEPDDTVEVELLIEGLLQTVIRVYGKVVRVETTDEGYKIAIKFTEITEGIRNLIAKFVFEKQRELIMKKRRESTP